MSYEVNVNISLPTLMKSTNFEYVYSLIDPIRGSKGTILKMRLTDLSNRVPSGKEFEYGVFLSKYLSMVFENDTPIVIDSNEIDDTRQVDVLKDALEVLKIPDHVHIARDSVIFDQYEQEQEFEYQEPESVLMRTKMERRRDYTDKLREYDSFRKFLFTNKAVQEFIKNGISIDYVHPTSYDITNYGAYWYRPTGLIVGKSFLSVLTHAKRYMEYLKEVEELEELEELEEEWEDRYDDQYDSYYDDYRDY